jgi:ABC-2 type transport system ATP-binding protein
VVYGFLGPNGAGKTTTMRVLTGLIHADGGTVEILGKPFKRGDRHRLFEVGALVESPTFYPYLSARANLRELAASGAPVASKRIEELLDLVGLCDRANDKVQDYSMGMKQRLGIAAALLNDPKLLLLDEPANGLDPAGIVAMRDTLRALASQGKTVLISSHLLAEIQVMADTVGIIASGKLVREGPLKELLSMQAVVKVRVQPNQVDAAVATLAPLFAAERLTETDREEGWLTVHIAPDRAEEVSQKLAGAGIYVSGMESGTDLEMLFLELTGGQAITGEGTFVGLGGTANGSATTGKETAE